MIFQNVGVRLQLLFFLWELLPTPEPSAQAMLAAVVMIAVSGEVNVFKREAEGVHKRQKQNKIHADLCEPNLEILGQWFGKLFTRISVPHEWIEQHRIDALYLKDENNQIVAGAMCKDVHTKECEFDLFKPGHQQISVTFDMDTTHKHLTAFASCSDHGTWSSDTQSVAAGVRKAHSYDEDHRVDDSKILKKTADTQLPKKKIEVSLGRKSTKIPQYEDVFQWLDFSGVKHEGSFTSKLEEFGIQFSEDLLQLDSQYMEDLQSLLEPGEQTKLKKLLDNHPEF